MYQCRNSQRIGPPHGFASLPTLGTNLVELSAVGSAFLRCSSREIHTSQAAPRQALMYLFAGLTMLVGVGELHRVNNLYRVDASFAHLCCNTRSGLVGSDQREYVVNMYAVGCVSTHQYLECVNVSCYLFPRSKKHM